MLNPHLRTVFRFARITLIVLALASCGLPGVYRSPEEQLPHATGNTRVVRSQTVHATPGDPNGSPVPDESPSPHLPPTALPLFVRSTSPAWVPEGVVDVIKDGATWGPRQSNQRQPEAQPPLAASDPHGTLWVQFPPFVEGSWNPRADGHYMVMYTPLNTSGDLLEGSRMLFTLPGRVAAGEQGERADPYDDQYVGRIAAIGNGRFLLWTYITCCGAQNGALGRIWWIEPGSGTAKVVASGRYGGGNFAIAVHNEHWLFWNRMSSGETTWIGSTEALLVDLHTGQVRSVDLGGDNWTWEQARWNVDGKLHFPRESGGRTYTLDPVTGQVAPLQ